MRFSGPNRQVKIFPNFSQLENKWSVLECLAQFDTSKTERLEIRYFMSAEAYVVSLTP